MLASPAISSPRSTTPRRASLAAAAGVSVHALVAAWIFAPALWGGRMLYFRDISTYFYPNLVFLERSLRGGVWPLWHPGAEAGTPLLATYPVDVLLVFLGGAAFALAAGPPLHMLLASLGATALGRRLGMGPLAAWACGLVFGLSGFMLSAVNLMEKHQAAAWAPLVLATALRVAGRPRAAGAALLALVCALQVSTLAGEIVLQTAAVGVVLLWSRLDRRALVALGAAGILAALLAAPALLGAASVMKDTRRGSGFSAAEALSGSASPIELAGILFPRFFGDMHTFTDTGFWGQDLFAGGFPYLISLYVGASVLALALAAGRSRLWAVVAVALLLAVGAHGPLGPVIGALAVFRTPVKFVFAASLALAVLAGYGLDRARAARAHWTVLLPGAVVTLAALALRFAPQSALTMAATIGALADPRAQAVMRAAWPDAFLLSGLLALATAAAALRGGRLAAGAAVTLVLDLLVVNGDVNRFAPPLFYDLRPEVRALLEPAFEGEPARVFGYGIGNTPGLQYAPPLLRENADVWLYYLDRQVLWGRTPVLDGLDGAFDEDRTAFAPSGSTLEAGESVPAAFMTIAPRLRLANVRWILSFAPLPGDLARERGDVSLPEVVQPLRLFELRDALPRALFVPTHRVVASAADARAIAGSAGFDPRAVVILEREPEGAALPVAGGSEPAAVVFHVVGPHSVELRARTPPGYVLWLSGWSDGWVARRAAGATVPVLRADGRYIALPTPGGEQVFDLEYRPAWRRRSLALTALGLLALAGALVGGRFRRRPAIPDDGAAPGPGRG